MHATITLIACAGQLFLALLALWRGARSPLGMPLALLAVVQFSWGLPSAVYELTGQPEWLWLSNTAAPMNLPIALHFVLAFVGRRRSLAWLMFSTYAVVTAFAASTLLAFVSPRVRQFVTSSEHATVHLALGAAVGAMIGVLLLTHLRRVVRPDERARTQLVLYALALVGILGFTEPWSVMFGGVPRLGNVGALASNLLLAFIALRWRLFGRDLATGSFPVIFVTVALGVVGYLAVFASFSTRTGPLVAFTGLLTLSVIVTVRRVLTPRALARERLERLATLGRFSAQMAHDLKNPIAALKGAAQFLEEEHARGASLADKGDFLKLIVQQTDRLSRVVEHYQRLGRIEPVLAPQGLNALVRSVLSLQEFAGQGKVRIVSQPAEGLPELRLDRDLIAGALENLVRNAMEAMPQGGTVTVRTGLEDKLEPARVFLDVQDTGEGMDPRTRERAFDDFFTTKATGSGLGLAFVRRVVEAHGGEVRLTSKEGSGTTLRLVFVADSGQAS